MPRTIEKVVYKFDELEDDAKEKARRWYREGAFDHDWWDAVYEDAVMCAKILGIDLVTRRAKLMDGSFRNEPSIQFSGFWSQGDGACFEGTYSYAKDAPARIREHASLDAELHRIADELEELQKRFEGTAGATIETRGRYSHSGSMDVSFTVSGDDLSLEPTDNEQETMKQLMRDFADWIYHQLEKEYEWMNSDEQVDGNILANDYEFDERGNIV